MKPQTILILSLVGNLALATTAYHYIGARSKTNGASAATSEVSLKKQKNGTGKISAAGKTVVTNFTTEDFTWHNVEAEDYKIYIANLRAVDCPEETIRDIIVADVNKLYAGKFRALRPDGGKSSYWKSDQNSWNSKEGRERQKKYNALSKEKSALLVELLGVDPEKERRKEMGYLDWQERNFSFLPEEKRQPAKDVQKKFEEMRQEVYSRGLGMIDADDQKELRRINAEQDAEMAKILTPQELEDYNLRASQIANQMRYDLDGFEPTENEFREIYKQRKAREEDLAYGGDPDDKEANERGKKARDEMDAQIKSELGDERFAEYKRAQDYSYKELARMADRLELPKGTAVAVYDMKKVAEDQVKEIRENKDLTSEQRNTALQAVRDETEKAVIASLGGQKNLDRYKSRGGYWISNLAPTPRRKSTAIVSP